MLTEIRKGVIIGFLLTILYGVIIYIYENQNKNNAEIKTKEEESLQNNEKSSDNKNKESATVTINIENQKNGKYYIYNGYEYKNKGDVESKFLKRNLGYEKKIREAVNKEEVYNELKLEYCAAITEIKKVDKGIMSGTNIPFTQVSYMQVDDAYKEYLQKIAQIKQAISLTIENKDIERETGCYYEPTRWDRVNNLNYRLKNFL